MYETNHAATALRQMVWVSPDALVAITTTPEVSPHPPTSIPYTSSGQSTPNAILSEDCGCEEVFLCRAKGKNDMFLR